MRTADSGRDELVADLRHGGPTLDDFDLGSLVANNMSEDYAAMLPLGHAPCLPLYSILHNFPRRFLMSICQQVGP